MVGANAPRFRSSIWPCDYRPATIDPSSGTNSPQSKRQAYPGRVALFGHLHPGLQHLGTSAEIRRHDPARKDPVHTYTNLVSPPRPHGTWHRSTPTGDTRVLRQLPATTIQVGNNEQHLKSAILDCLPSRSTSRRPDRTSRMCHPSLCSLKVLSCGASNAYLPDVT
jgi:hypothetical protein